MNIHWENTRSKTSLISTLYIYIAEGWYTMKTRNVPHHPRKIYTYT